MWHLYALCTTAPDRPRYLQIDTEAVCRKMHTCPDDIVIQVEVNQVAGDSPEAKVVGWLPAEHTEPTIVTASRDLLQRRLPGPIESLEASGRGNIVHLALFELTVATPATSSPAVPAVIDVNLPEVDLVAA